MINAPLGKRARKHFLIYSRYRRHGRTRYFLMSSAPKGRLRMAKISVPKPATGSMNKNRPLSDLLRSQVQQMREVEKRLPHFHQTHTNVDEIRSEGQAAAYIRRVTSELHHLRHKVRVP